MPASAARREGARGQRDLCNGLIIAKVQQVASTAQAIACACSRIPSCRHGVSIVPLTALHTQKCVRAPSPRRAHVPARRSASGRGQSVVRTEGGMCLDWVLLRGDAPPPSDHEIKASPRLGDRDDRQRRAAEAAHAAELDLAPDPVHQSHQGPSSCLRRASAGTRLPPLVCAPAITCSSPAPHAAQLPRVEPRPTCRPSVSIHSTG